MRFGELHFDSFASLEVVDCIGLGDVAAVAVVAAFDKEDDVDPAVEVEIMVNSWTFAVPDCQIDQHLAVLWPISTVGPPPQVPHSMHHEVVLVVPWPVGVT